MRLHSNLLNKKDSHEWRQRRISKMPMDVKEQILTEIKTSPLFSFQLYKSTDVN